MLQNTVQRYSYSFYYNTDVSPMIPFNSQYDFKSINQHFAKRSLEDFLQWCLATFGDTAVQVTSFGPTGMVLLDHLARLYPGLRVITLDTGFLFPETHALMAEVQRRYPINLEVQRPALTVPALQEEQLWQTNPDRCCYLRKVLPLQKALQEANAWFTGLRRDQSNTRATLNLVAWDSKYGIVKLNPMANWTRAQVWQYITEHKLPYNTLHDQGYASIGCTHCTKPANAANERAGRWQGQAKVECGIHLSLEYISGEKS